MNAESLPAHSVSRLKHFLGGVVVLVLMFNTPLRELIQYAAQSDLSSYILIIPFICAYLFCSNKEFRHIEPGGERSGAAVPALFAVVLLILAGLIRKNSAASAEDYLAASISSFVFFVWAVAWWAMGRQAFRRVAFPIVFLILIAPLPTAVREAIENGLQLGSAWVADGLFQMVGTPVYHDGAHLKLPGIGLEVARQCSGIHSTLVLFIASLLAAYLFFKTPWKRTVLVFAVFPIALLRNGFRIFTIGQLCIHYGPQMIDSPIHRKGGPIFFALSLIPLLLLVIILRRIGRRGMVSVSPKQH